MSHYPDRPGPPGTSGHDAGNQRTVIAGLALLAAGLLRSVVPGDRNLTDVRREQRGQSPGSYSRRWLAPTYLATCGMVRLGDGEGGVSWRCSPVS